MLTCLGIDGRKMFGNWFRGLTVQLSIQMPLQVYLDAVTPEGDAAVIQGWNSASWVRVAQTLWCWQTAFAAFVSWFVTFSVFACTFFLAHEDLSDGGAHVHEKSSLYVLKERLGLVKKRHHQLHHPLQTVPLSKWGLSQYMHGTNFNLISTTSIACMDAPHQGKAHWDLIQSVKKKVNCWNDPVVVRTKKQWCRPAQPCLWTE